MILGWQTYASEIYKISIIVNNKVISVSITLQRLVLNWKNISLRLVNVNDTLKINLLFISVMKWAVTVEVLMKIVFISLANKRQN